MAKIVKFLGKPYYGKYEPVDIPGMTRWEPGEERLFDDAYARSQGFEHGDEFAIYFVATFNIPTVIFQLPDESADEELNTVTVADSTPTGDETTSAESTSAEPAPASDIAPSGIQTAENESAEETN